jgi:hypothetical protein
MPNPFAEERESRRQLPQSVTLVQESLIMSTVNDRRTRANTHTHTHKQNILRRWTALQKRLSWTDETMANGAACTILAKTAPPSSTDPGNKFSKVIT